MEIREVAVIGLGTMGAGIAEVFARAGIGVVAIEADAAAMSRGVGILDASLSRAVTRGRLTAAQQAEIRSRIRPAAGFGEAAAVDLAIEVVPERMAIKREIFAELDRVCSPDAILATNTSSLSVTAIAAASKHPGRVIGMHFFNPAPVMRLVEVVSTVLTTDGVTAAASDLARRLGKTPVEIGDRAGFIANALLLPYLNHALHLMATGYASRADIDLAATAGIGLPMGPLALLDLIGLDTALSIMDVLHGEFGLPRYMPTPLLRRLSDAGRTGRKAGRGIYDYAESSGSDNDHQGGNSRASAAAPKAVTLIGAGDDVEAELASAMATAGINVTRNAAHPTDLVLIAAEAGRPVLPASLAAGRPQQSVGLHLVGKLAAGTLAEVVQTSLSSADAIAAGTALAAKLGLVPVRAPDRPGFLAGQLLYAHLADAVRMCQEGYSNPTEIDTAMKLGCGYPRGPFELIDAAGAATVLTGLEAMHEAYGYPEFAPPPLLAEHAAAGIPFSAGPRPGR
ncbi:MAG TPA: 3-hydroxyacyl-CoA dehydrogenase NAD-binding domain-containing protein [Streptosporangiaceae bacterium]|nr:3-hydroxyacyl-CoA dehydrogenase NAD-binding domain-containing protein [Streptosporangiaceae bacterium]